jgi:hypothetical protein
MMVTLSNFGHQIFELNVGRSTVVNAMLLGFGVYSIRLPGGLKAQRL